jgi:hypothetical protein
MRHSRSHSHRSYISDVGASEGPIGDLILVSPSLPDHVRSSRDHEPSAKSDGGVKTLGHVTPTAEQLTVIDNPDPGYWLIKGAAGSGKTTTALLRLRFLVRYWRERRATLGLVRPIRVLVLSFNRTLRGYIAELAEQQVPSGGEVDLEISTFGSWSNASTPIPVASSATVAASALAAPA